MRSTSTTGSDAANVIVAHGLMYKDLNGHGSSIERGRNQSTTGMDTGDSEEVEGDEPEMSALEYARLYGLSKHHMSEDPITICKTLPRPTRTLEDLGDPEGVVSVEDVFVDGLTRERIETPREALLYLQTVIKYDEQFDPLRSLPELRPKRILKLELPLLRTDHELDVQNFGRTPELDFRQMRFPAEHVDVEMDEGIEWPQRYTDLPKQKMEEVEKEKLKFPKETIEYLQALVTDDTTKEDLKDFFAVEPVYRKRRYVEPITPPLFPLLSPPLTPFDPSSPAAQLPLLSGSSSTLDAELETFEKTLQRKERIEPAIFNSSDDVSLSKTDDFVQVYSPLMSVMGSHLSSSPRQQRRIDDLMVEVPFIPDDQSSSSPHKRFKSVSFSETLHDIIPPLAPSQPPKTLDPESEASLEAFMQTVIEPLAREAEQALEQEKLQDADTLHRMQVPIMDFRLLPPPWKTYINTKISGHSTKGTTELDAQRKLLKHIKDSELQLPEYGRWPTLSESKLNWLPFPIELAKAQDEEVIDDMRYIATIMSDMSLEDVVTSGDLVWKPEGLRALREDGCEEEDMEPMLLDDELGEDGEDIDSLVRKRKRAVEEIKHVGEATHGSNARLLATQSIPKHIRQQAGPATITSPLAFTNAALDILETGSLLGGPFSASTAISNFMNSMGQQSKRRRIEIPEHDAQARKPASLPPLLKVIVEEVKAPEIAPPLLPPLPPDPPPKSFIITSSLHQHSRPLIRTIAHLYRHATFIERDFSSSLPNESPEADIILSPSTGLLATTLQKIRQKPLPGAEVEVTGIKGRIATLSERYERIVVLVGDVDISIDDRDCEIIADFAAFCSVCSADVEVVYVPCGEVALATWVVECMLRFGVDNHKLLDDETLWELFLRRAGLNAFAAQIILAALKKPTGKLGYTGLRAFVCMGPEERVRRFEMVLGGRRVLGMVNRVLEMRWLSAKNGFTAPVVG